ncbi:MAG: C-GCAxxG-C-C family protein [Desulfurococcaceae archaeon]
MDADKSILDLDKVESYAKELGIKYHGCSQMSLKALQDSLGLEDGGAFKAASALAGGVARGGEVCGALLGALMAVSLVFGRDRLEPANDSPKYSKALEVGTKVFDEFKNLYGSVRCRDIQVRLFGRHYDLRNPKEREEFSSSGNRDKCSEVIAVAARIAAKAIIDAGFNITPR